MVFIGSPDQHETQPRDLASLSPKVLVAYTRVSISPKTTSLRGPVAAVLPAERTQAFHPKPRLYRTAAAATRTNARITSVHLYTLHVCQTPQSRSVGFGNKLPTQRSQNKQESSSPPSHPATRRNSPCVSRVLQLRAYVLRASYLLMQAVVSDRLMTTPVQVRKRAARCAREVERKTTTIVQVCNKARCTRAQLWAGDWMRGCRRWRR